MARKIFKKIKKKEELIPSFLLDLTAVPENVIVLPRTVKSVHHLGPVFFGCHQHHPPAHSLNLRSFHYTQFTASSTENILRDIYFPKPEIVKRSFKAIKVFHPIVKRKKLFHDLYLHKCPGTKKVFVPEVAAQVVDFGQTNSIIEGETSMEIPLYRLKRISSRTVLSEEEVESIAPSDVWEKRRIYLSYKERMAHSHFPKQFVTVILIGPTIPAALTITKLPSKRRTPSDINFQANSKKEKMIEVSTETTEATKNQVEGETFSKTESGTYVNVSMPEALKVNLVRNASNEESGLESEIEKTDYYQKLQIVKSQNKVSKESLGSVEREN